MSYNIIDVDDYIEHI